MSSSSTPSRLSLAPSRESPQDGTTSPPPLVVLALSLKPFATKEPRRDLTVAKRAFEGLWGGLERCAVLSQSCRRLGERAAAVLLGIHRALEALEQQEQGQKQGKSYEFDGSKAGSSTKIKLQSTLIDLQAFATDFSSNKNRQQLLVHGIQSTLLLISSLNASLASAAVLYSLSLDTSSWAEENALDLRQDNLALPRLFQHAIAPRGPTYDAFVKARPPPAGDTSKRRDEFIEWCFEQQPLLRPDPESPLSPRRKWTAPPSPGLGPPSPSLDLEAHRRGLAASPSSPGVLQRRRASEGVTDVPSADMRRTASASSSTTSALGVGLAPGGSEMLRRASAPETASASSPPPIISDHTPLPTVPPSESTTQEAIEDEELMEGISRQGRRPSDDPSFTSTEMSPSSSVDSRVLSSAQAAVAEKISVAAVVEEKTAAVEKDRDPEGPAEVEESEAQSEQKSILTPAAEAEAEPTPIAATSPSPTVSTSSNTPAPTPILFDTLPSCPPAPHLVVEASTAPIDEAPSSAIEAAHSAIETPLQLKAPFDLSAHSRATDVPPLAVDTPAEATPLPSSPLPTILEDPAPRSPLGVPTLTLRPATPTSRPPSPPQKGLRILALDGGGIRGLSLLLTLKSILPTAPPCEQFDLITGVGSGALVAILLGRLRLDVASSIELYNSIARRAFIAKEPSTRSRWSKLFGGGGSSTTSTGVRDQALEQACSTFLPSESTEMVDSRLLADNDDSLCKTAVLAYHQQGRGGALPCWFRSYEEDSTSAAEGPVTLCQALRASMASSPFFQPYQATSPDNTFSQSPSTSLNPADATLDEAHRLFGAEPITHFLSIGVGAPPPSLRLPSKGKTRSLILVRQLGTASRSSGERFRARTRREGWAEGVYRRVEVALGDGEDPGLEEWASEKAMGAAVGTWCAKEEIGSGVRSWLKGEQALITRHNSLAKPSGTGDRSSLRKSMSLSDFAEARALYLHSDGSTSSLI